MSAYDPAALTIKLGRYATGPASALTDPLLLGSVQAYRRLLGGSMQALDREGIQRRIPRGTYHVSRKIDGEFNALVYRDGEAFTVNPGGTVRIHLPFCQAASAALAAAEVKSAVLAGELYSRPKGGGRPRVHDVVGASRQPASEEEFSLLSMALFDIIEVDGTPWDDGYDETWKQLSAWFPKESGAIHRVETQMATSVREIAALFEAWVEDEGAEGIVARNDTAGMFKIKPRHTLDLAVIGFAEGIDDRAGLLHDLLLAVVRPDGLFQVVGRVGGGFSEDQRRELLSDFRDIAADSHYTEVNSDRVAYQMVRPEQVCEINCLDVIAQTTRGGSINRMILRWDVDASCWHTEKRLPLASLLSPEFVRLREDKSPGPEPSGIDQLTRVVEIESAGATLEDIQTPRSELLRRSVHTKVLKGNTMVRKLLLWKTNKEQVSRSYPAYVLSLTDFSPNRKEPLDREIRVSDSREQIECYWEDFADKYFVRGWTEV